MLYITNCILNKLLLKLKRRYTEKEIKLNQQFSLNIKAGRNGNARCRSKRLRPKIYDATNRRILKI